MELFSPARAGRRRGGLRRPSCGVGVRRGQALRQASEAPRSVEPHAAKDRAALRSAVRDPMAADLERILAESRGGALDAVSSEPHMVTGSAVLRPSTAADHANRGSRPMACEGRSAKRANPLQCSDGKTICQVQRSALLSLRYLRYRGARANRPEASFHRFALWSWRPTFSVSDRTREALAFADLARIRGPLVLRPARRRFVSQFWGFLRA